MVTAYRRHEARCKYAKKKKYPEPRKHKDCTCPVHMDGFLTTPSGEKIVMRGSLETRNWGHGQILSLSMLIGTLATVRACCTLEAVHW